MKPPGAQCVISTGMLMTLRWCANSWGVDLHWNLHGSALDQALVLCGWRPHSAVVLNKISPTQSQSQSAVLLPNLALSPADISGVRLVGDQGPCAGRVEVFLHGRWGTVCSLGWNTASFSILCGSLGCGSPLETSSMPASGHSLALHGLLCGPADHISQCSSWLSERKLHADVNAVVVVCSDPENLSVGSSRHHVFFFWSSWIFRLLIVMAVFVSIHLGTHLLLVSQKQN
ncbi:unnamed protein product [Caretta caretta]